MTEGATGLLPGMGEFEHLGELLGPVAHVSASAARTPADRAAAAHCAVPPGRRGWPPRPPPGEGIPVAVALHHPGQTPQ